MPVTYVIEADAGLVVLTATGPTAARDIADVQLRLRADPAFRDSFDQLFDFRTAIPADDIRTPQVESLLKSTPFSARTRRAYIVSPGAVYGMGRVAQVKAENRNLQLRVFLDPASARAWLMSREPGDTTRPAAE